MHNKQAYIWSFLTTFSSQGVYLLTNIVLARFLSPQEFGTVGVLAIFISLSTVLGDAGLGGSLIKEHKITSEDISTVFTFNFTVSCILYALIFISSNYIEQFYTIEGLSTVARVLCLSLIINSFSAIQKALLYKKLNFKRIAIISIISIVIASITALTTCYYNWGVYSLVAFQISNNLCQAILYSFNSLAIIHFKFVTKSFTKLLSFGAFTTISGIIDTIYENILSILFGKFLGVKAVGFYDQAKKLENGSAYSLVTAINNVSFPVLAKYTDNISNFKKEAKSIFSTWMLIAIPLLGIIALYSKEVITLLYGENWISAAPFLTILMINGIVYIAESIMRNNLKSLGEVKTLSMITLIKRLIGIGIIFSFLSISGFAMMYGLLLSTFIGFLTNSYFYCQSSDESLIRLLRDCSISIIIPVSVLAMLYFVRENVDTLALKIFISIMLLIALYVTIILRKRLLSNNKNI